MSWWQFEYKKLATTYFGKGALINSNLNVTVELTEILHLQKFATGKNNEK